MSPSPPPSGRRPRLAVHKFTSCDGCQLSLLNLGEQLLDLAERFEIVHFAEFGVVDEDAEADIALVEGSVSTPHEVERIKAVRAKTKTLIAIGACATGGGIQALRNRHRSADWVLAVYPQAGQIDVFDRVSPLSDHVRVDLELTGCPITAQQLLATLHDLLAGVAPAPSRDKLCLECKRRGLVCVVVTLGLPCLGPVTVTGCGVLCPGEGRDCYGCSGPAESPNAVALAARLRALGLSRQAVELRFRAIHSAAAEFADLGTIDD